MTPKGGARWPKPVGLVLIAMLTPHLWCQEPAEQLKIKVLQGEGDVHRPGDKAGTAIEIAVLNEVDLPQPDAVCSFTSLQPDGPSVQLEKDTAALSLQRKSDADGKVLVEGIYGNKIHGSVTIQVACSFEGKKGRISINQVNERGPILTRNRVLLILGAMAGTGIGLYEAYKPGPPTASINAPTGSTGTATFTPALRSRVRR